MAEASRGCHGFEPEASRCCGDIGAGTSYFARHLALHTARVYAVDFDPGLLQIATKSAPPNLVPVLAQRDDPKLASS
jgi:predicted RNA methylase